MIIRAVTITAVLAIILFFALFFVFQGFFVDGRVVLPWDPDFAEVQPAPSPDDNYSDNGLIDEYEESSEHEENEHEESSEHEENEHDNSNYY